MEIFSLKGQSQTTWKKRVEKKGSSYYKSQTPPCLEKTPGDPMSTSGETKRTPEESKRLRRKDSHHVR